MNKRYFAIGMAAMLTLTACQDEFSNGAVNRESGITATIANEENAATRSVMIDAPLKAMNLRWTGGDAIGIFDSENQNTRYVAEASDISADSTQATFRSSGAQPKGAFLAYFPHQAGATGNTSELHLTMPARQHFVARDFKAEPDPEACIMVGSGYQNAVSFRNVSAILKVNYVPRDSDVVTAIVFRDLAGQPVSGAFTVTLDNEGTPTAKYPATGEGETIILDCGAGVEVAPTNVTTFFMVVPAREYTKGFKLDFQLQKGETDVRTIGRKAGKTLLRSLVYNVGDVSVISKDDYTVVFNEDGGVIFDDDLMAMVYSVKNLGGIDGEEGYGDYYELMVKPGMGLQEGMTVVINQQSEALPYGLIGKVVAIKDLSSTTQQVRILKYRQGERAFKKMTIGPADALNADGTPNEDKMMGIDLTQHFSRFVPAEGLDGLSVKPTQDGWTITDEGWTPNLPVTRGSMKGDLQFPRIAINLTSTDTDRLSVGASPGISAGIGASISDGKIDYVAFTLTPSLKVDVSVEKTLELAKFFDEEMPIGTMYFAPITVGPVVLVPVFRLSGFASLKGELKISATWSYTLAFNVGATYQNAYNSEGWLFRCSNKCEGMPTPFFLLPELAATASITAQMGMILDVGLSFYGIIDFTLYTKAGMGLGASITFTDRGSNGGMFMTPICEGGAAVGVLGKNLTRRALVQIDAEPWWSRDIYPHVTVYADHEHIIHTQELSEIYALPVKRTDYIPVRAQLTGLLLDNVELYWRVMRRPKGAILSEEELVKDFKAGTYPASSLLYSGENVEAMEIAGTIPASLVNDENYTYAVYVFCQVKGATQGAYPPKVVSWGRVEIHRENDINHWYFDKKISIESGDFFLIRDDGGGALLKNGEVKYYSGANGWVNL